jgi:hypothetical protein
MRTPKPIDDRAIKQLPRRGRVRLVLGVLFAAVFVTGVTLTLLEKHGRQGSMVYLTVLIALVISVVLLALTGRPLRCPDCGKFLREESNHPKAQETYLYFCKNCDVIWDTTIGRSSD